MKIDLIKEAVAKKAQQNYAYEVKGSVAIKEEPVVSEPVIQFPTTEPANADTLPGYNKEYVQFRQLLTTLVKDKDYGQVPGTKSVMLYTPGIRKILHYLHLRVNYSLLSHSFDAGSKVSSYVFKAELISPEGEIVSTGVGSANGGEKKFMAMGGLSADPLVCQAAGKRAVSCAVRLLL
jgi:hypothetical protein